MLMLKKVQGFLVLSTTQLQFSGTPAIIIRVYESCKCMCVKSVMYRYAVWQSFLIWGQIWLQGDNNVEQSWQRLSYWKHEHTLDGLTWHIGHRHVQMYQCVRSQGGRLFTLQSKSSTLTAFTLQDELSCRITHRFFIAEIDECSLTNEQISEPGSLLHTLSLH